jgi:plasmid stabilization system protein ParE
VTTFRDSTPGTVGRFLEDLEQGFDNAAYNPRIYQPYEWNKEYRRIVIDDYLAFYKINDDEKRVDVLYALLKLTAESCYIFLSFVLNSSLPCKH